MTQIGTPEEEPVIEIIPREEPVPRPEPVAVPLPDVPVEEPEKVTV